jgi:hypothetical protein
MKITSIAVVCLVLLIMPLGLVFAQSNNPTLTYKYDTHGFIVQYPTDWQKHEGQPGDTIIVTFTSPLSGNPAYKIDYSYVINTQEGPIKIKNLQVWTISGDNAYILTFGMESSKYSDYAPLIDDIINSFKLVQSQTAALNT